MITLIAVASTIAMMISLFNANVPFALFSALILLWACLADTPKSGGQTKKAPMLTTPMLNNPITG